MPTDVLVSVAFGFCGGIAAQVLIIRAALVSGQELTRTRKGRGGLIVLFIDGSFAALVTLAYALSESGLTPLLALQIGAGWPLIVSALARNLRGAPAHPDPGAGPEQAAIARQGTRVGAILDHFAVIER